MISHGVVNRPALPVTITLIGVDEHSLSILLAELAIFSFLFLFIVTALSAAIAMPRLFNIPTTAVIIVDISVKCHKGSV